MSNTKVSSEQIIDDVALGGNPTTTTQSAGNNTTRVATTAFVTTAVSNLVDSAPSSLDTLNELAAAMNDNASFFSTVLPLSGGTMTGNIAHASDFTLDVGGTILLDSGDGIFKLRDDGSDKGRITVTSDIISIVNSTQDGDIKFDGLDGSSSITALRLDMSDAGKATFNSGIDAAGNIALTNTDNKSLRINSSTSNAGYLAVFQDQAIFSVNRDGKDGGFADTGKAAAVIKLNSADADSNIEFQTTTTNNASPTTRLTIDKNGNLGIGETSPLGKIHAKVSDTSASASAQGNLLVLEDTENGLSILSSTSGAGYINFGDSDDNDIGMIIYDHSANAMRFWANAAERVRISGNNLFLNGGTDARIQLGTGGAGANQVSNNTVHIRGDGVDAKYMAASGGVHLFESNGTELVRFTSDGVKLPSGKGIDFSATGDAANSGMGSELLDDYEEGTFTVSIENSGLASPNGGGTTYNRYVKVGRKVFLSGYVQLTADSGSSNAIVISGLPFATDTSAAVAGSIITAYGGGDFGMSCYINNNYLQLYANNVSSSSSYNSIQYSEVGAIRFHFGIHYYASS